MSGTRVGLGRSVALGVCLALALLLLGAAEAKAGKYSVAQCGWHVDADANWADSTGGAKFRSDAWCATAPDVDPFDGAHLKSFTRSDVSTVSGTRFARWRWVAPPTTGITRVSGTWWHTLHDGLEQRIGVGTASGGFDPFASAAATDVTPRDFVAGLSSPQPALEDRLLCARAEDKWCSLDPGSWSAVRALTITLEDDTPPSAGLGGDLTAGGWRRGDQGVSFWGGDGGAGVRYGETLLDGGRVAFAEYPCAVALIGSEWRGTRMQPCPTGASGSATVATTNFSDGPHSLWHCTTDFAGNGACVAPRTVLIDNNPPAHPRNLALGGAEGWRRDNDFDLAWSNPDQGKASAIGGASWRIVGPGGFDSGAHFVGGHDLSALRDLRRPPPASTPRRSGCATRPATRTPSRRSRRRCASTTCGRRSPSTPPRTRGSRTRSAPPSSMRTPDRPPAKSTSASSAPTAGSNCRAGSKPRRPPGRPAWSRPCPSTSTPAPTCSAPTSPTRPATPPRPRCAPTAKRWRCAKRRPLLRPAMPPFRRRPRRRSRRGRRPGSSPGCAGATAAARG